MAESERIPGFIRMKEQEKPQKYAKNMLVKLPSGLDGYVKMYAKYSARYLIVVPFLAQDPSGKPVLFQAWFDEKDLTKVSAGWDSEAVFRNGQVTAERTEGLYPTER